MLGGFSECTAINFVTARVNGMLIATELTK